MLKFFFFAALALSLLAAESGRADPLLFDNFDTGYSAWSASGDVSAEDLHVLDADSVRLRSTGSITRTFSTVGYESVRISGFLAARLLEGSDACRFEVSTDGGASFISILVLANGDDDGEFRWTEEAAPGYSDNPNVVLRFRNASDVRG